LKIVLKIFLPALAALILSHSVFHLIPPGLSHAINDLSAKYLYTLSGRSAKPFNFVGVAVDDYSISSISQRWPWRRTVYAGLIDILSREKARAIGVDLVFVGDSEDKNDDAALLRALEGSGSRVVLACTFDSAKGAPVVPLKELGQAAYLTGLLNTPTDDDAKVRRLRGYVDVDNQRYYSFSLALSAAFLGKDPANIASALPLAKDRTFFIRYLLKPQDVTVVSAIDVLEDLKGLKERFGRDFLKDALVLIYPSAAISRDSYLTPVGRLAGGFLHLNGVADILLGRHIAQSPFADLVLLALAMAAAGVIIAAFGFGLGVVLLTGVLVIIFWCGIVLGLRGIGLDFARIFNTTILFFILAGIFKYADFLVQLARIREKVTLDPLTGLFSLRYFFYRVAVEARNIHWGRKPFLLIVGMESLDKDSEKMTFEELSGAWKKIGSRLNARGGFWSAYDSASAAGYIIRNPANIASELEALRGELSGILEKRRLDPAVRVSCAALNKGLHARKLLEFLSESLKKQEGPVVVLDGRGLAPDSDAFGHGRFSSGKLLENIDRDIEEKNRQLLSYIDELKTEHAKTREAYFQIMGSLVNALEAKDTYTEGHSERVSKYALLMADRLNWNEQEKEKLQKAALLHDLGKIGIPDSILHKQGKLTDEEFEVIRTHEVIGVKILRPLKELEQILPWILHHHERWDGLGYPQGLRGDAIPLGAQIISLSDVFDALTTGRDYKKAFPVEEARQELIRSKGTMFNPALVDIFLEVIKDKI
jgi:putative nucleotidyltransferase with HDIG domain